VTRSSLKRSKDTTTGDEKVEGKLMEGGDSYAGLGRRLKTLNIGGELNREEGHNKWATEGGDGNEEINCRSVWGMAQGTLYGVHVTTDNSVKAIVDGILLTHRQKKGEFLFFR